VYQLLNPVSETIKKVGTLQTFANGYLQLNNVVTPTVNFNYPVMLASVVSEHTKAKDELEDVVVDNTNKIGDLATDYTKIISPVDDTGTANTYVITLTNTPTAYAKYQTFRFIAKTANTGASTLNVNGLGAKTLVKDVNVALVTGDILVGQIVTAVYDGTNFQIIPDFKAQLGLKADLSSPNFTGAPTISTKSIATTETTIPTLLNGWVAYDKINVINTTGKLVTVNLHVKNGAMTYLTIICNAGKPAYNGISYFPIYNTSGSILGSIGIDANSNIFVNSLSSNTDVNINFTYITA
jgi:hypothetical protein